MKLTIGPVKLRVQIRLMFAFMMITIMILLGAFVKIVDNVNRRANRDSLESAANQLALGVENHWRALREQAGVLAYNNYVAAFVESETPGRRYANNRRILSFISSIEATNTSIDKFLYINDDILCISNSYFSEYSLLDDVKREYLAESVIPPGEVVYARLTTEPDRQIRYAVVGNSYYDAYLQKPLLMVLLIDIAPIVTMVENLGGDHTQFRLLDDRGAVIADSGGVFPGEPDLGGTDHISCEIGIQGPGWKVVALSDSSTLAGGELRAIRWVVLLSLCMMLLITLFVLVISNNVVTPITRITGFVQSIGDDYTTRRLQMEKHNEIGIMCQEINRMLDNIHRLNTSMAEAQKTLYLGEISKRQVRIAALQSQINPHFLYNTLDCIRGIALKEGVRAIADMASAVSKIFRYSIKAADYVTVADEVDCIRDYMVIIGIRHNNRFSLELDIKEELLDFSIPKMILQPIVENAVFHGLEPKRGQGLIRIRACREDGHIVFTVEDDGIGMEEEQLDRLRRSLNENAVSYTGSSSGKKSVGMLNIYQRLALTYGEGFCMRVARGRGGGTVVGIRIPGKRGTGIRG